MKLAVPYPALSAVPGKSWPERRDWDPGSEREARAPEKIKTSQERLGVREVPHIQGFGWLFMKWVI